MRTTWMLAAVAAFAALPAVAQTVVEKQVTTTTQTRTDCAAILNDAERLACWQARAYVAPSETQTTERVVSTADGAVQTVQTTTAPTAVVPAPVTTTRTVTTSQPAPVVVSRTTTTTRTSN
jgi:hypothetical protein